MRHALRRNRTQRDASDNEDVSTRLSDGFEMLEDDDYEEDYEGHRINKDDGR